MDRLFLILAGIIGALGVGLGAFGAHGLRGRLTPAQLATFETGVRYLMYHALALVAVAWTAERWPGSRWPRAAGWLFLCGVLLFSGSLILLSLTGASWLGMVAPLGGLAFILGWLALAAAAWRAER